MQFVNPPLNLKFKIGECNSLKNSSNYIIEEKLDIINTFPNPFNPEFRIKFFHSVSGLITVKIINLNGQIVDKYILNSKSGLNQYNIYPQALISGKYFLQLSNRYGTTRIVPIIYIK